jgi:Transcriptional regulator, AbiEi antitoxin, Type IV TA system
LDYLTDDRESQYRKKNTLNTIFSLANVHEKWHVHDYVNKGIFMNTMELSGSDLEKSIMIRLKEMLGQIGWLSRWKVESANASGGHHCDLIVTIPKADGSKALLCVECKQDFRPSLFPRLVDCASSIKDFNGEAVMVLAAPSISPRVAELCAEHGWGWLDLAGNYRIDIPDLLHLQSSGRPPVHNNPRPVANLSTREACRVIRALLSPENAGLRWTQRHLVEHFMHFEKPIPSPSLGLVNKVVQHLRDEAYIENFSDGGFRVMEPQKLLVAWRDVYRFDRHKRLKYFSLLNNKSILTALDKLGMLERANVVYASFSAAEHQAPNVRQPKTWLYIQEQALAAFERCVEAKPVDSGENLVVLIPDDESVFYQIDKEDNEPNSHLACTNAVQTYVDVWNCGGRGKEAADSILEQRLRPAWLAKGKKE